MDISEDISFELQSTMSPKIDVTARARPPRKPPTKLALKKHFRRSSMFNKKSHPQKEAIDTVIVIESTSESEENDDKESSKSSEKILNRTLVVISDSNPSDSEDSEPKSEPEKPKSKIVVHEVISVHPEKKQSNIVEKAKEKATNESDWLSNNKFQLICNWMNQVQIEQVEPRVELNTEPPSQRSTMTLFTEISTISGLSSNPGFVQPKTNVAINSTCINVQAPRFDQLFTKKNQRIPQKNASSSSSSSTESFKTSHDESFDKENDQNDSNKKQSSTDIISNSLSDDLLKKSVIDDSFENDLNLDESLTTRLNKKTITNKNQKSLSTPDSRRNDSDNCSKTKEKSPSTPKNTESGDGYSSVLELESILDSLYGESWKKNKEKILPASAPCSKTRKFRSNNGEIETTYKNPYIDAQNTKSNNKLLRTIQVARVNKALESPWVKNLNDLCDPDSDLEKSPKQNNISTKCPPTKLNFDDDDDDDKRISYRSLSESDEDDKRKPKNNNDKLFINDSSSDSEVDVRPIQKTVPRKNTQKTFTFLESLSGSVPISKCDISARIYRTNFKAHKDKLATKLFALFNENIFEGAIPQDTPIEWNARLRGTAGFCYCRKITRRTGAVERAVRIALSIKVIDSADRLRDTLVHEMCHAATWIVNQVSDGHGPFWKSWAKSAMRTFPELPPIKRCHDYAINYKFTYKCKNCGYSFGRHMRSIDVDKKCCANCRGKFEVFINKTTKTGEVKTMVATPKKQANGFALFVKENYEIHKTPERKHGDVMKLLGQKFSSLKINK